MGFAHELNKIADGIVKSDLLQDVFAQSEALAMTGEYTLTVMGDIDNDVELRLKKEGFSVTKAGNNTEVSWLDAELDKDK